MDNLEFSNFEMGNQYELSPEFNHEGESYELVPELFNEGEIPYQGEYQNESPSYEVTALESEMIFEMGSVTNEQELGNFIRGIGKKVMGAASGFINSPAGQQLTQKLTNIAQKTIPEAIASAGTQAGAYAGGQLGGVIDKTFGSNAGLGKDIFGYAGQKLGAYGGQRLGTAAGNKALSFIRFAKDAFTKAREINVSAPPAQAVNTALVQAARKHYPVVLRKKCKCSRRTHSAYPGNKPYSYEGEYLNEYSGEFNTEDEYNNELTSEGIFNETAESELASELLSINSDHELDMFLGKLISKAAGAVKSFAKSSAGKALGGVLKNVAKTALPIAGKIAGNFLLPGVGGMIGGKLGSMASNLFEIEPEGLSGEDMEYQVAKRFVRFAGSAANRAARIRGRQPVQSVVRHAVSHAGRLYAPGIINNWNAAFGDGGYDNYDNNNYNSYAPGSSEGGTWHRSGNAIILRGI